MVEFSAAGSTDPEGVDDLVSFQWTRMTAGDLLSRSGSDVALFMPLGATNVGLTVGDRGRSSTY